MANSELSVPKRRSEADKIGKHKYEVKLLHRLERKLDRVEQMMRIIFHGLEGYFRFERPLVEKVACESDMDLAVVSLIFEAGTSGILAKEIGSRLPQLGLDKHRILHIVSRVNRNVEQAFGRPLIEKRGKKWAFTDFGMEIWGKTTEDEEDLVSGDKNASQSSD